MRVGITGASGFIGSALARAFTERGDEVVRFIRPGTDPTTSTVRWDPARGHVDVDDLRRVGGLDALVNLAGTGIAERRWSSARKTAILHSRVDSTRLLVESLQSSRSSVGVFASGSAIGYYGSCGDVELDESSPNGGDFLAHVCAKWEEAALELATDGTPVALLRTGIVMSRRGGALQKQLPLFRLGLGGPLSRGDQWLSPIALRDEVRAILWIVDHKMSGIVNLVSPDPVRNEQFTKILAHQLHRPSFARIPALAVKLALGSELASVAVLASQRVRPKVLTESGFLFEDPTATSIVASALKS
jgi:hypothetical protein